jgi:chromosomal replication initiator protein
METVSIWDNALNIIKERVNKQSFETWFKPTKQVSYDGLKLLIEVPNTFCRDWIETRYAPLINDTLKALESKDISFSLQISETPAPKEIVLTEKKPSVVTPSAVIGSSINPKHTFENFIVGLSNRFAHGACVAVAEAPAKSYNPVFIYGGVGLGKTHLIHAIGNYIRQEDPSLKIAYLTSEQFLNEMINALTSGKITDFRNKYRYIDILLIDDIQFLAGKEAMQEEFFHTFNVLHSANKQIVATSDRKPQELKIEERLKSRFEMGLIADIGSPDIETRVAILKKKAEADKISIPDDVCLFIANIVKDDVRELEGCLTKVIAFASITKSKITLDVVKECLKDAISRAGEKIITVEAVKEAVVKYYKLKMSDMITKKRTQPVAFARQVAMYIARELTELSLPEIGQNFGGRDHSTVIHAYETIQNKKDTDLVFNEELNKVIDIVKNG